MVTSSWNYHLNFSCPYCMRCCIVGLTFMFLLTNVERLLINVGDVLTFCFAKFLVRSFANVLNRDMVSFPCWFTGDLKTLSIQILWQKHYSIFSFSFSFWYLLVNRHSWFINLVTDSVCMSICVSPSLEHSHLLSSGNLTVMPSHSG
jgi:hypothetical protein